VLSVSTNDDVGEGPNVETALSMSPTTAMLTAESHKPTIGTRKQAPAKKGVKTDGLVMLALHTYISHFTYLLQDFSFVILQISELS